MGSTYLSSIRPWLADEWADDDLSQPIGGVKAVEPITLTRILITDTMTVDYGAEEEGFEMWRGRPLDVRSAGASPAESMRLMTIEIATRRRDRRRATAIITVKPASANWFGWADFKGVTHDPAPAMRRLADAAAAAAVSPEAAVWARLSRMKTDPFGNEDTFYARFRQFDRTDTIVGADDAEEEDGRTPTSGKKANRALQDPEFAFGICDRFADARAVLRASELLAVTLQRAKDGIATKHDGSRLALSATTQQYAPELMEAAVVRALAGPGIGPAPSGRDVDRHGAAAVVARRIFDDEIRNLHKRSIGSGAVEPARIFVNQLPRVERAHGFRPHAHDDGFTRADVLARVDKAIAGLAGRTHSPDAWLAVLAQLRSDGLDDPGPESDLAHERLRLGFVYAAALSRTMAMPDAVLRRLEDLRRAYPVFVDAALDPRNDDAGE